MNKQEQPAVAGRVERPVRPCAWADERAISWLTDRAERSSAHITTKLSACGPSVERPMPLYDQAALEATADDAARVARAAEAHYWQSMVERLTAQADEWNRRYMALLKQVADARAMQPAPTIVVDMGPNGPS